MIERLELGNLINSGMEISEVQKVLDSLPFYVLIVDEDHNIFLGNKAVQEVLGLKLHEIIGGYCPRVIHGCTEPVPYCPLEIAVKESRSVEIEHFDEQTQRWISSAIYPIEGMINNGKRLYFHLVQDVHQRKETETQLIDTINKLQNITQAIIKAITITVEKRDPYTAGHQQRVSRLSEEIAIEMGLPEEQILGIKVAGLVHDIGKIAVPIEILSKPGKINNHEYDLIKIHSNTGFEILNEIEFPWPVARIVLQHHEKLDGSGYPDGLCAEEIMTEARVLCVADVVEAMSSHRPYRQAFGIEFALDEITKGKDIKYDRNVVEACLRVFEKGFCF